jgi:YgiT-type zinc finger domain-containing protein
MKCAICKHGETTTGFTTIVLEKGETTLIFKKVPAQICDNCGEEYISSKTNQEILKKAKHEINKGIALELLNFQPSLDNIAYAK